MRQAVKKCGVCATETAKYTCPADLLPYCSLACFRTHKESKPCTGQRSTAVPPTGPATQLAPATNQDIGPTSSATHDGKVSRPLDRPLKRLRGLRWPTEPDSTIFMDPLRRDEVKPLRGFELEAVATHPPIRTQLASLATGSLRPTLQRIAALRTYEEKEHALRTLLDAPSPPKDRLGGDGPADEHYGRGRGRGRGRGPRRPMTRSTGFETVGTWAHDPLARRGMLKFADEIRACLQTAREGV